MPAVLVHGVPDTDRVWRALIGRLRRTDVVTLSFPGFGCTIPPGFDCTKDAAGVRPPTPRLPLSTPTRR